MFSKPGGLLAGIALCGFLTGGVVWLAGFADLAEILWTLTATVVLAALAPMVAGDLRHLEGKKPARFSDPDEALEIADPEPLPPALDDPPLPPVRQGAGEPPVHGSVGLPADPAQHLPGLP